jgi:hypothetical protein
MLDEQIKFAIKNKGNGNIQALIDGADNFVFELRNNDYLAL